MVSIFEQRNAPEIIRRGLRVLLPDHRFLAQTNPGMDPFTDPYVTVISAGSPGGSSVTDSENVHITVYAGYEPVARDLAVLIDGLLLSPSIDWGFSISPGPGLITAPDDATKGFLAAITVVAASPKNERLLQ
ncbi:hypothetical protein [uncultured Corynebacterium sp.]|uniref:hypothetical protein n=1 Tax=uncultured Corynebacterium sp. TaxID=159447 RepID=UPI0025F65C10|nr:hypothetical protein [uncultured Corynebacterium sp.]